MPRGRPDFKATDVKVFRGKVVSVDPLRWTATVVDEDNGVHQDIAVNPTYITTGGAGSFHLPAVNSMVWLMRPSTGRTPFILASSTSPKQTDEGDDAEDPNDLRQNRPVLAEGDHMLASTEEGGFVIVRNSGVIEIGSSQFAKRFYIPLRNTIRDFFENYLQHAAGGSHTWEARREDDQHGVDRTPTEWKLDLKEFAEDGPLIKVRMGRSAEEDAESVPQGVKGGIVASLNINDRYKVWIDRNGCMASVTYGAVTTSHVGPRTDYFDATHTHRVRGRLVERFGDRSTEVERNDEALVRGSRRAEVTRDDVEVIGGSVTRTVGGTSTEHIDGESKRYVGGEDLSVQGNQNTTVSGGASETVGEDKATVIAGGWDVIVHNKDNRSPGLSVAVSLGAIKLLGTTDDIVIGIGKAPSPLLFAQITLSPSGKVKLSGASGNVTVELNNTGVRVATKGGTIDLDAAGNIQMGPAGPAGAVVTTMTHKVDFVTGIPIMGSASVGVTGVPSVTTIPPTFAGS
jgi:hypothetical protein